MYCIWNGNNSIKNYNKYEKKMENASLELKKTAVTTDTLTSFKSLDELEAFGNRIATSGFTPLKEGKDVVAAILYGRELGLPEMTSVNNIYPINGKGTLSVHLLNALLQKNGIVVEVIKNYEPCMNFAFKGEDGKAAIYKGGVLGKRLQDGSIPEGYAPLILREGFADETPKDFEVKGTSITNYKTVLRFTRMLKQLNGTYKETIIESSFSLAEAQVAELYPQKNNWKNYPKQMTLNRALAFGARLIAADITMGMYETSELADAVNLPYTVIQNGEKVQILDPVAKVKVEQPIQYTEAEEVKEEGTSTETVKIETNPSQKNN